MIDLSEYFVRSARLNQNWRHHGFECWRNALRQAGYRVAWWEDEENWAQILYHDRLDGYLWRNNPLLMFRYRPDVGFDACPDIELIVYPDFDEAAFTVSPQSDYSGNLFYFKELVDWLRPPFSISDIWFYTVSV